MKTIITYKNGDLDGIASAYAYSEYLNKIGDKANYYICGYPPKEVEIVCSLFDIKIENNSEDIQNNQIIIVDTNTGSAVDFVDPSHVIEIIDHHPRSSDLFENARIDIQQIGAVCTIIAEKYKNSGISISRESALLLYYGIVSNTLNFHSKTTTDRDLIMSEWLKAQCSEIDESLISTIFEQKSKIEPENLRREMEVDELFPLGNDKLIIGQLEIANAKEFLDGHKEEINNVLDAVRVEWGVDLVFINIVDILEGSHILYTPYEKTKNYLHNKYGFIFDGDSINEKGIVLRKEIKKYLRDNRS